MIAQLASSSSSSFSASGFRQAAPPAVRSPLPTLRQQVGQMRNSFRYERPYRRTDGHVYVPWRWQIDWDAWPSAHVTQYLNTTFLPGRTPVYYFNITVSLIISFKNPQTRKQFL
jgi:hypothetical protein